MTSLDSVTFEEGDNGDVWACSTVVPVLSVGKGRAEAEVNFARAMRLYKESMQEQDWPPPNTFTL